MSVVNAVGFSLVRCKGFCFLIYTWQGFIQLLNFVGLSVNKVWAQSYIDAELWRGYMQEQTEKHSEVWDGSTQWYKGAHRKCRWNVNMFHGRLLPREHRALCSAVASRISYKTIELYLKSNLWTQLSKVS